MTLLSIPPTLRETLLRPDLTELADDCERGKLLLPLWYGAGGVVLTE
jgi:hypothetical protein